MIIFKHKKGNKFLITNYKVMFSTLAQQNNLERVSNKSFVFDKILMAIGIRKKAQVHFLLRDPELRLQSFFHNKFRQHIIKENYNDWEHCQRIFFNHLGIKESDSSQQIKETILQFSYEDFIHQLKDHYLKDAHLLPQSFIKNLSLAKMPIPLANKIDVVYLMEREFDIQKLEGEFNLNLSQKMNESFSGQNKYSLSEKTHQIVRTVYESDYRLYAEWS